jgi:Tol biopolymer transport system component
MSTNLRKRADRRRRAAAAGLVAAQVAAGFGLAGTAHAAPSTERVSVNSAGIQGNNHSGHPSLSSDGSQVAFSSVATNLAGGISLGQVYVRDKLRGATELVSMGQPLPNGRALSPSISNDGRFVAFQSRASNLVTGDTNDADDIFIKDRVTGSVLRASRSSSGVQGNAASSDPAISPDGRYVAFVSSASNLVSGDTNNSGDIFVFDQVTRTTTRASTSTSGVQGDRNSMNPSISRDGSRVVFESFATNLIAGADTNQTRDVFVGSRTRVSFRASQSSTGVQGNSFSSNAVVSDDGRAVAFESRASNLVSGDTNSRSDVFHHDVVTRQTTRASNGFSTTPFNTPANGNSGSPDINHDGRVVTYRSDATNLVAQDPNGSIADVFVAHLDRPRGAQNTLVSVSSGGAAANGVSSAPALSSNAQVVGFASAASNLVGGDTNAKTDAFRRTLQ